MNVTEVCAIEDIPTNTKHTVSKSLHYLAYIQNHLPLTTVLSHGHKDTPTSFEDASALSNAGIQATSLTYVTVPVNSTTNEILFVGHSDGSLRAYSPNTSQLIFSERYHDTSPILSIKAHSTSVFRTSFNNSNSNSNSNNSNSNNQSTRKSDRTGTTSKNISTSSSSSEIWMLHEDGTLVVLHLGHAARAMRSFINNVSVEEPCLHRKWRLQRNQACADFVATTPSRSDLFETNLRPSGANVLVVGQDPFCSVFLADGDTGKGEQITIRSAALELGSVVLSGAADVASNFLPSWFSGRSVKSPKQRNAVTPWQDVSSTTISIPLRRHRPLFDAQRIVTSTSLSSQLCAAACVDNLGRITLIDMNDGTVLRMFKGYRDAQVGWMSSERHEYLVVYAPHRNRIKVWKAAHGPLVCSIDVKELTTRKRQGSVITPLRLLTSNGACYIIVNGGVHRLDLNHQSIKSQLKRHYVTATNQKDGDVLSKFADGVRSMMLRKGNKGSTRGDRRDRDDDQEDEAKNNTYYNQQQSDVTSLSRLLEKIEAPDLLLSAAEVVREELAEKLDCSVAYRELQTVVLNRLLKTSEAAAQAAIGVMGISENSGNNGDTDQTPRKRRNSVVDHMLSAVQELSKEIVLLKSYYILDQMLIDRLDEKENEESHYNLIDENVSSWFDNTMDGGSNHTERRITPGYFCRSFQVATQITRNDKKSNDKNGNDKIEVTMISSALSDVGTRRKGTLANILYRPMSQHKFTLSKYFELNLLKTMSPLHQMNHFTTSWFQQAATDYREMSSSSWLNYGAFQWIHEMTMEENNTELFDRLEKACLETVSLKQAMVLTKLCSVAWKTNAKEKQQKKNQNSRWSPATFDEEREENAEGDNNDNDDDRDSLSEDELNDEDSDRTDDVHAAAARLFQAERFAILCRRLELNLYLNTVTSSFNDEDHKIVSLKKLDTGTQDTPLRMIALSQLGNKAWKMSVAPAVDDDDTTNVTLEFIQTSLKSKSKKTELENMNVNEKKEKTATTTTTTTASRIFTWFGDSVQMNASTLPISMPLPSLLSSFASSSSSSSSNTTIVTPENFENLLSQVLPHFVKDKDGLALHRTLLLLCSSKSYSHLDRARDVCCAVNQHAATIVDANLRHAALLYVWNHGLVQLCLESIDLWSQKEEESWNGLKKLNMGLQNDTNQKDDQDTQDTQNTASSSKTEATKEVWRQEAMHRVKRVHLSIVETCQFVLDALSLCIVEHQPEHQEEETKGTKGTKETTATATTTATTTETDMNIKTEPKHPSVETRFPFLMDPIQTSLLKQPIAISSFSFKRHVSCLAILRSVIEVELWGCDVRTLFLSGNVELFVVGDIVFDANTTAKAWSGLLDASIQSARLQLVSDIAIVDVEKALSLSNALKMSTTDAFIECFRVLWCTGKERTALELFSNADKTIKNQVATPLVSLACEQVDTVLDAMRKDKRYRTLLSTVPANIYKSVRSAARKARSKRQENGRKESKRLKKVSPSLSETHSLLSRLVPVCPRDGPTHGIAVDLAGVVSTLVKRVEQLREQLKEK